jgi:hypothetical protein
MDRAYHGGPPSSEIRGVLRMTKKSYQAPTVKRIVIRPGDTVFQASGAGAPGPLQQLGISPDSTQGGQK